MSASLPTPLDQLRNCPFSFYPPIVNIQHNEWRYRRANWSEIQVVNTKTGTELWVPRRFVGEVSLVGEPVMIVGLVKELEYREGIVAPHIRRVIQMPRAVNDSPGISARRAGGGVSEHGPADVVGIRIETPRESRAGRIVFGTIAAGLLACVGAALIFRDAALGMLGTRFAQQNVTRIELPLTSADDYDSVTSTLGAPVQDEWRNNEWRNSEWRNSEGLAYRRLWYPRRGFAAILIGGHYAGAIDANGRVLHCVAHCGALRTLR